MYGLQGLETRTYSYRLAGMNRALVIALTLCLPCTPAMAHKGSTAHVTIRVQQDTVLLTLRATTHDLAPTLEVAPGLNPVPELYRAKRATVLKNITAFLTLRSGDRFLCRLTGQRLILGGGRRVSARLTYRCPRRVELLELKYDLLFDAEPRHRAIVTGGEGATASSKILTSMFRTFRLEQQVSPWVNAADFLVLGVEHIFTGYDHLAFLLGLLLVAGVVGREQQGAVWPGLRYLLGIVTSFTLAHSITLVSAAMGWLSVPSNVVEPAIALSIAYVGLENLVRALPRRRWLLTFAFGLVHGFGFAHMLRDVGLPRNGLVLSLASFNLGVELGQLAVVALIFPLIHLLSQERLTVPAGVAMTALLAALLGLLSLAGVQVAAPAPVLAGLLVLMMVGAPRYGYRAVVLRGGSAIIALLGLFWLAERLLGVTLLGGHLG